MDKSKYGQFYWCIKLIKPIVKDEKEIYLYADSLVVENNFICFNRVNKDGDFENFVINKEYVAAVFAASVLDGHAVCVEHWKGEINENN